MNIKVQKFNSNKPVKLFITYFVMFDDVYQLYKLDKYTFNTQVYSCFPRFYEMFCLSSLCPCLNSTINNLFSASEADLRAKRLLCYLIPFF